MNRRLRRVLGDDTARATDKVGAQDTAEGSNPWSIPLQDSDTTARSAWAAAQNRSRFADHSDTRPSPIAREPMDLAGVSEIQHLANPLDV